MKDIGAFMVAGLGFGDEGKGSTVDFLVRRYGAHMVVRYNGGAQAGHRVVTDEGMEHVFSQFGSGTLVPGVGTFLSRFMAINPLNMLTEEEHLQTLGIRDAFQRTAIDSRALIITPFHRAINRLREIARGTRRNGSCGMGVGETFQDEVVSPYEVVRAGDLKDEVLLKAKLHLWQQRKWKEVQLLLSHLPATEDVVAALAELQEEDAIAWYINQYSHFSKQAQVVDSEYLADALSSTHPVVFEGAQGVLLDARYGFWPHVTKSNSTFTNAETLLRECEYKGEVQKVGVLRGYATRHGAGPFVTEDSALSSALPDVANELNPWQGEFRVGSFDALASRYAIAACGGVDSIALTCIDRLKVFPTVEVCTAYKTPAGKVMVDIPITTQPTHAQQQDLSNLLREATPVYDSLEHVPNMNGGTDGYVQFLETQLNIPITILSYGPASKDKQVRSSYAKQPCLA